jgi:peptidoglycan/LPS O-acetylase OafA/YrhL
MAAGRRPSPSRSIRTNRVQSKLMFSFVAGLAHSMYDVPTRRWLTARAATIRSAKNVTCQMGWVDVPRRPEESSVQLWCGSELMAKDQAGAKEVRRIRGFDGLRAIAFLLVFMSHKTHIPNAEQFGDIGVWMFFVLSGFLITRILARSREEIESGLSTLSDSLFHFYTRRSARIFPPYYFLIAGITLLSFFLSIDHFGIREKLAYFFYGTNVFVAAHQHWVGDFGHFWSLAVEEQFYLLFAPLVLLSPRRNTIGVCLSIIIIGIAAKILLETGGSSAIAIDVNSLINFSLLGFGGLIGLSVNRTAPKWLYSGGAQVSVLCIYLTLPLAFGTWSQFWLLFGKLSAVLAGILLFQIFNSQQSWFVAILDSAPLRKIGRVSYGAYLIHVFIHFAMIENAFQHLGVYIAAPRTVQVMTELCLSLTIAAISWRYIESPIIAWAARATSAVPSASFITHLIRSKNLIR